MSNVPPPKSYTAMMPVVPLVEAVGQRRRGRLVDDPQHLEAGDAPGVARRRALRVVEVRGHGDHGAIDLGIDLALAAKNSSARRFSSRRMNAEISGGVNSRSPSPIRTTPAGLAAPTRNGKQPRLVADVVDALAHEPLDRIDRAAGVGQQPPLRLAADVDRAIGRDRHDRRHAARRRSCRGSRPARRP